MKSDHRLNPPIANLQDARNVKWLAEEALDQASVCRRSGVKWWRLLGTLVVVLLSGIGGASGAVIFTNPITGTNPNTDNPYTTGQTFDANITVSGIGRGAGIVGTDANNRYNANSWNTAAIDLTAYFTLTLTPKAGFEIDFTNFVYTGQASGTGPTSVAFRSSIDGFVGDIGAPTVGGTTISLAGAAYQDIVSATEFRIYGWGASGVGGTFSINDFTFNGTVSAIVVTNYFRWDTNSTTPGSGNAGGSWSGSNWNSLADGTGTTSTFTDGQTPTFAAGTDATGAYSVTIDTTVNANGLTFEEGDVTLAAGLGTLTLTGASVSVASGASATIAEPIRGSVGMNKSGDGSLTVSGNNDYTGATIISGGTLLLGANDTLKTGASVGERTALDLAGGRLDAGGFAQGSDGTTLGTLTLSADSIIDMTGSSTLFFADSSGTSWPGDFSLSIYNWDAGDRINFGSASGLDESQLGKISFYSGSGSGLLQNGMAGLLANGDLVPVPEPSTAFAAITLLGALGCSGRRRSNKNAGSR